MPINPVAGVEVLESCEEDFFKHMDAQILEAPQSKKVIPEHIKRKIMEADTRQEANSILFDYLMSNSTKSSLSALCEVLKTTEGKEMAALGKDMLLKLKQGVCAYVHVCMCMCGGVHMCVYV